MFKKATLLFTLILLSTNSFAINLKKSAAKSQKDLVLKDANSIIFDGEYT